VEGESSEKNSAAPSMEREKSRDGLVWVTREDPGGREKDACMVDRIKGQVDGKSEVPGVENPLGNRSSQRGDQRVKKTRERKERNPKVERSLLHSNGSLKRKLTGGGRSNLKVSKNREKCKQKRQHTSIGPLLSKTTQKDGSRRHGIHQKRRSKGEGLLDVVQKIFGQEADATETGEQRQRAKLGS